MPQENTVKTSKNLQKLNTVNYQFKVLVSLSCNRYVAFSWQNTLSQWVWGAKIHMDQNRRKPVRRSICLFVFLVLFFYCESGKGFTFASVIVSVAPLHCTSITHVQYSRPDSSGQNLESNGSSLVDKWNRKYSVAGPNETDLIINGLRPGTNYSFQMLAFTSKGKGVISASYFARSSSGIKPIPYNFKSSKPRKHDTMLNSGKFVISAPLPYYRYYKIKKW